MNEPTDPRYAATEPWSQEAPPLPPPRVSLLAVFSLLSSLACCLPGFGVLGMGLGGSALLAISHSQGRLRGKPAAAVGILLGLMATALQGAFVAGVVMGWNYYIHDMAPTTARLIERAAAGDVTGARTTLAPDANQALSDEAIQRFAAAAQGAYGNVQGAAARISQVAPAMGRSFRMVRSARRQKGAVAGSTFDDVVPVPVVLSFALDEAMCWAIFDANALSGAPQRALLVDALLQLPDGSFVALRRDGPAVELARALGLTVSKTAQEEETQGTAAP